MAAGDEGGAGMSIKLMNLAWSAHGLSSTRKFVLLSLCDQANDDGLCYPSLKTIAERCALSERAVYKVLADLESFGLVRRESEPGKTTRYHIQPEALERASDHCTTFTPERRSPLNDVHPTPERDSGAPLNDVHPRSGTLKGSLTEPPIRTTKEPSERGRARAKRATRLPPDWKPTAEMVAFCRDKRPDLDPQEVAERFRDYWIAQPGQKGRKLDWLATWRNWVRNEKPGKKMRRSGVDEWLEGSTTCEVMP